MQKEHAGKCKGPGRRAPGVSAIESTLASWSHHGALPDSRRRLGAGPPNLPAGASQRKVLAASQSPLPHLSGHASRRDALRETDGFTAVPASLWDQDWVVHCQPVGNGRKAFQYLAPYVFRVAISNSRLVSLDNDQVTFRYRDSNTGQPKLCTLEAEEFIRRSLRVQHILPKGFVKVRYATRGFLGPGAHPKLALIRQQLSPAVEPDSGAQPPVAPLKAQPDSEARPPDQTPPQAQPDTPAAFDLLAPDQSILIELEDQNEPDAPDEPLAPAPSGSAPRCPSCGQPLRLRTSLTPKGRSPP